MQPAFSVIFLTTLIGAAQGLFLALFATEMGWLGHLVGIELSAWAWRGASLVLLLSALGLLASFFHLGRPERAWRAASMWRTSWLSREVIALPLFMLTVLAWGGAHLLGVGPTRALGVLGVLACLALFVCTAMIYASVRFLQEWATPLTVLNYILLGCASGFTLATALAAGLGLGELVSALGIAALSWTGLAALSRGASLWRNARLLPKSNLQSALGIKHPRIVQKSMGFMGGSFNTHEFFHGRSAHTLRSVQWAFIWLVFVLPLLGLALGLGSASAAWLGLVALVQYLGLLAERWFFFAQARHPQNLYYQTVS